MNPLINWLVQLTSTKKKNPTKAMQVAQAFHHLLGADTAETKLFFAELSVYASVHRANDPHDTNLMIYNEGKRDMLFHIMDMVGLKEADFIQFNRELNKLLGEKEDDVEYR